MSVNRLCFIPADLSILLNEEYITGIDKSYFDWVPSDVHAVQWYGDQYGGDIEFGSPNPFAPKKPNQRITKLGEWEKLVTIFNEEKQRREQAKIAEEEAKEAARNYWEELRSIRNGKLYSSDWTQLADAPITAQKVSEWESYRQQLRNLPDNITDPKPMVLAYYNGEIHPDWPVEP